MSLFDLLMNEGGATAAAQLGERFGLETQQVEAAMQHLVPALGAGLQRNVSSSGGLAGLLGALSGGSHGRYLENPALVKEESTTHEGNQILGHLLGSKEASRELAADASSRTGIGTDVLKQMLPVVATLVMGAISKKSSQEGVLARDDAAGQPQGFLGLLAPLLQSGPSGPPQDSPLDMIGRYLRNR